MVIDKHLHIETQFIDRSIFSNSNHVNYVIRYVSKWEIHQLVSSIANFEHIYTHFLKNKSISNLIRTDVKI